MSSLFYNGHLTIQSVIKIKEGDVEQAELLNALSHIAECEECAQLYAAGFKSEELTQIPKDFANEVLNKAKEIEQSERRSFAVYVAQVAVSACAALAITFSGSINLIPLCYQNMVSIQKPVISFTDNLKSNFRNFTQNSIKREVIFFEKKEK